jgi:YihY family inner membrane protein
MFHRAALGFAEHEGFMSAAAIAYYAFLSLFPFSILLLAVSRRLLKPAQAMTQYHAFLDHYLPGVTAFLQINYVPLQGQLTLLRILALLVLIWSGSGIFAATGRLLDRAWHVRQRGRLWIRRRLLALPIAGIALILIAISLFMSTTWSLLNRLEFLNGIGWFTHTISLVIILALNTLFFSLVYWSLPSVELRWREMLPGAILASVLWEVAKSAFTAYLSRLSLFNVIYGSVATIAAFLIWAYLSGCIVLFCGELNAEYTRRQHVTRLLEDKG